MMISDVKNLFATAKLAVCLRQKRLQRFLHALSIKTLAQFPMIGPHGEDDVAAELLLQGKKPLGWIMALPIWVDPHSFPHNKQTYAYQLKLDEAVQAGRLKAVDVWQYISGPPDQPIVLLNFRHYSQPGKEPDLLRLAAYNRQVFNGNSPSIALAKSFGAYLGYRKRDEWLWKYGSLLPFRGPFNYFTQCFAKPAYWETLLKNPVAERLMRVIEESPPARQADILNLPNVISILIKSEYVGAEYRYRFMPILRRMCPAQLVKVLTAPEAVEKLASHGNASAILNLIGKLAPCQQVEILTTNNVIWALAGYRKSDGDKVIALIHKLDPTDQARIMQSPGIYKSLLVYGLIKADSQNEVLRDYFYRHPRKITGQSVPMWRCAVD